MNIVELKKVIEVLKKYKLEDSIEDINIWLMRLTKKQVENLIALNEFSAKKLESHKDILLYPKLLNSDNYIYDINLIIKAKTKEHQDALKEVATDVDSLSSEYHQNDMKLISKAKSPIYLEALKEAATSINSLRSEFHEVDMKLIFNAKTESIAESLAWLCTNYDFSNSNNYEEVMSLLAKIYNENIQSALCIAAVLSFKGKYHKQDMRLIAKAKTEDIAFGLKEVATDKNSLISGHHDKDMLLISNSSTSKVCECLSDLACNTHSLNSIYHRDNMKKIANAKSDEEVTMIYNNIILELELLAKETLDDIYDKALSFCDGDLNKNIDKEIFLYRKKHRN